MSGRVICANHHKQPISSRNGSPSIAFFSSVVVGQSSSCMVARWLMRILKYLVGTPRLGLVFKRGHSGPRMQAYFDAAFADAADYKSTTGWIAFVDGAPIAYDSTTIKRVVSSSTEAECNAMAIVAKESTFNRRLFSEIFNAGTMPPTSGDNSASIMMLDAGVTKRSRHYAIEWFLVRDRVDEGELKVEWVPTETNLADFFTKKLPRARFTELRDAIMCVDAEPVMVKMMNCDDDPWQGYSRAFEEWLLELNPDAWIGGYPGLDELAPSVVARVVNAQEPPTQEPTQESGTWPEPEVVVPPAQPGPEDCECKLVYPLLDFSADPVMPKHLKQGSARLTRDSKLMQTFIITYLNTLHAEMLKAPDYWFLVRDEDYSHLALSKSSKKKWDIWNRNGTSFCHVIFQKIFCVSTSVNRYLSPLKTALHLLVERDFKIEHGSPMN